MLHRNLNKKGDEKYKPYLFLYEVRSTFKKTREPAFQKASFIERQVK